MTKTERGFTLLELMVTLAIAAIITVFAVGQYRRYLVKAHLQEATSALSENYLYLERMYTKNNGYIKADKSPITTADLPKQEAGAGDSNYTITLYSDCSQNTPNASSATFCLVATPGIAQAKSTGGGKECGVITVNQAGKWSAAGQKGLNPPTFKCF